MSVRTYFQTTGIIFLIITVLHLLRLIFSWDAAIGGWSVPMWLSVVALIIAGYLGYQGVSLSKK